MGGFERKKEIHLPRRTDSATASRDSAAPGPTVTTTLQMPANGASKTETPITEEAPSFWEKMLSIPKSDWADNCTIWIYRLEPRTRMLPGERGYLDILTEPITPDYIKKRWGGGRFRIILNRSGKIFAKIEEDIEGEPIYDRREAVGGPSNGNNGNGVGGSMDGNVLKVLEQQNERLYQVLTTLQGAKDENPAVSSAVDILTSAYKTGLSAVAGNPGGAAGDPLKQFEAVLTAAERIASIRGGSGGGALGSFSEVITLLTSLGVVSKPKSLAEQIADAKALQELVGGGGEPKDWKAAAVQAVTSHLPEILDTFKTNATTTVAAAQARREEAQARARAAETLRTVPINSPVQPGQHPHAQPAAPQPSIHVDGGLHLEPRDEAATPAVNVALPAAPAPAPVSQEQYDEGLKVQVVNMMRYGATGAAIAAFLEDVKPELAADLGKYPEQTITTFFSQDPILKFMVEDPRWNEVLADAREYLSEEEIPVN